MRVFLIAALLTVPVLSACGTTGSSESYAAVAERMAEDCRARGGILVPNGELSGRPQADHACQITGGATRINRSAGS